MINEHGSNKLDNVDEFTRGIPIFCNFVPTENILRQMIFRACELQSNVELWQGYEPVWNKVGEIIGHKYENNILYQHIN